MILSVKTIERLSMSILLNYVSGYAEDRDFDTNLDILCGTMPLDYDHTKDSVTHWEPFEYWTGDDLAASVLQTRDAVLRSLNVQLP